MTRREIVRWQTDSGVPLTVGGTTITPQAQALIVRLPGAVWMWKRPSAVLVEQEGLVRRVPIVDVTRIIQLGLLALALVLSLGGRIAAAQGKESHP